MADGRIRQWWRAYQQHRADNPWPRKSPRRFRAVIMPGVFTLVGLALVLVPAVHTLGIAIFLGGLAASIIAFFLAAIGD